MRCACVGRTPAHLFTFEGITIDSPPQSGGSTEYRSLIGAREISPGQGTLVGRVGLERRPVLLDDVLVDPDYEWTRLRAARRVPHHRRRADAQRRRRDRSHLALAAEVDPFTAREIDVALAFAAQGAIAIRNANLMHQLELRSRELAHSRRGAAGTAAMSATPSIRASICTRCFRPSLPRQCSCPGPKAARSSSSTTEAQEFLDPRRVRHERRVARRAAGRARSVWTTPSWGRRPRPAGRSRSPTSATRTWTLI